jgi:hypothetical protein
MSRTDKDRPYWVRIADPKEDRRIHHNHYWFGAPIRRRVHKVDENGDPIYTEGEHTYRVAPYIDRDEEGNEQLRWYVTKRYRIPVYEYVIIGYRPLACTINYTNRASRRDWVHFGPYEEQYTCGYVLNDYARNRPRKNERKEYHKSAKARQVRPLRNIIKQYNAGEDVDGYDHPELNTRVRRHKGWWY